MKSIMKLSRGCEELKHSLSISQSGYVEIECLYDDVDYVLEMNRETFNKVIQLAQFSYN